MHKLLILFVIILSPPPSHAVEEGGSHFAFIEPAGYGVYPIETRGIGISHRLFSDLAIESSYITGEFEALLAVTKVSMIQVDGRFFLDPDTSLKLGVSYDQRESSYQASLENVADTGKVYSEENSIQLNGSLGTSFSYGMMKVGCDLIGFKLKLATLDKKEAKPDNVEQEEIEARKGWIESKTQDLSLQFLRVYMGVVF